MKDEYDFSDAARGRFYREGAVISASIQLETDLLKRLSELAKKRDISTSSLIDEMLRREMEAAS
jgi:predicted DNA-binding ribbon-helix-helix protein